MVCWWVKREPVCFTRVMVCDKRTVYLCNDSEPDFLGWYFSANCGVLGDYSL